MIPRHRMDLNAWPDPLLQERLEDMGFCRDPRTGRWVRFCDEPEIAPLTEWLQRHQLTCTVSVAPGRGETKLYSRLSAQLIHRDGGGPTRCGLCGAHPTYCRQWIEGDDTDSVDYPAPARFYLCGTCVQHRMQPHPRLYAPAPDAL